MTADGRVGRPFTLRLAEQEEHALRAKLAELAALPYGEQPDGVFGYSSTRRRGSFGGFVIWAALQYCAGHTKNELPAGHTKPRAKRAGKVKAQRAKRVRK